MKFPIRFLWIVTVFAGGFCDAPAQGRLTDVVVFSTDTVGNWSGPDVWQTQPNGNYEIFIQNGSTGGAFLNGPTSSNVQPNITLVPGINSFRLFAEPGADYADFGINLFFNGSSMPSISAFVAMATTPQGTNVFLADAAQHTPKPFPGANTGYAFPGAGALSFLAGSQLVSLSSFSWATPSVYKLDNVGGYSVGPDGVNDYVGGITLSVTQVPEPEFSLWVAAMVAGVVGIWKRLRQTGRRSA